MKITIIGLGLIGGSIGLGLKNNPGAKGQIAVIGIPRRQETIAKAVELGAADEGTLDLAAGVKDAEIVFICTPINLILPTLRKISRQLKPGAIVTDVGSTKEIIVKQAEKLMPKGTYFVGGHPMAGKEKVKLEAAEADLFQGKTWILTPTRKTNPRAVQTIRRLVGQLGGKIIQMDPKTHDSVVAGISHLPLLVAAALVNAVSEDKINRNKMKNTAASGFRDTTRVASGDPELGVDMFTANKKAVLKALGHFKNALSLLENSIKIEKKSLIAKELKKAKDFRDSIF